MEFEPKISDEEKSECRALVPLTVPVEREIPACPRPDAAFVTQLAANVKNLSPYRVKRRVNPEAGAKSYRDTVADALACRPKGQKLNYCA